MTLRLEQILAEGVSQCSYLVGDDAAGTACVVDPRPDVDIYFDLAHRYGLAITHVFETHIHADFVSGARELTQRLGDPARLFVSAEGGARYDFDHEAVRDGDRFEFGEVVLEAKATPGHTPEHVSYLLYQKDHDTPWGILTGDSFFVSSVGRPDLLGAEKTDELVSELFDTVRGFYLGLDDGVIVYPGHAAGSACGPDIGDRMSSTIGYEKRHNPFLQIGEKERFAKTIEEKAPPVPTHYPRLKKVNAAGPPVIGSRPRIPALAADDFREAVQGKAAQLLDTRDMLAFGGGYIKGALNIAARPELSVWAGWMLDPGRPLWLVVENETGLDRVLALLWRVGFVEFGGYLAGGMRAWREKGLALERLRQMSVHELKEKAGDEIVPLDVRSPGEWAGGHIPHATHLFLGELRENLDKLDKDQAYATYCGSGFRSSIAASLLAANGFSRVQNIPGSWKAWKNAGFGVEETGKKAA